jgi:hypothetical protein
MTDPGIARCGIESTTMRNARNSEPLAIASSRAENKLNNRNRADPPLTRIH